jgi:hypothetical protein
VGLVRQSAWCVLGRVPIVRSARAKLRVDRRQSGGELPMSGALFALQGHCVPRQGQGLPPLSPHPFLRLRHRSSASLRSDGVRDYPGMPFGFPPELVFSFAGIPTPRPAFAALSVANNLAGVRIRS